MQHSVLKLGGSVLRGPGDSDSILEILGGYQGPLVVVVSALKGVTDRLEVAVQSPSARGSVARGLREEYRRFARAFCVPPAAEAAALARIEFLIAGLERLLSRLSEAEGGYATNIQETRVIATRILATRILATGERLAAVCIALALLSLGRPAPVIEPGRLGLVARPSDEGDGSYVADIEASAPRIREALTRCSSAVVPGFYGIDAEGQPRLFGRGGSDYSAAVLAACLGATSCDLAKDVAGWHTADPAVVSGARVVAELSFGEAQALASGGAKILHESCLGPLRAAGVPLRIIGGRPARAMTRVFGDRAPGEAAPRAIALNRGPGGGAELTVAGFGAASRAAPSILRAFAANGLEARSFSPGIDGASFRLLVEASRGDQALRVAHDALFGERQAAAAGAGG